MHSQSLMTRLFTALAALALVAAGCQAGAGGSASVRPAGAIVLSPDDSHLYVADTDNDQVVVVNAAQEKVEKTIKVGHWPERIQVGLNGRLFVSNRQDRSISVVDPSAGTEVQRIAVGTEPLGLAMSPDGRTLAVANLTASTVSIIDAKTLTVTRTIPTPADPSGVALVDNGKLYVTHARSGLVSVFDPSTGTELTATPLSLGLDPSQTGGENRLPGQPADPVFSNGRLFLAMAQSKQDPTPTPLTTAASMGGNAYAGGSTPGSVAVVANGVGTIDTGSNTVLHGQGLEAFSGLGQAPLPGTGGAPSTAFDAVPPVIMTTLNGQAMSGASAAAIEPSGKYLYITNMNSSNVAILATDGSVNVLNDPSGVDSFAPQTSNGVLALVKVGAGPKGIAIPTTGDKAFVYNSFDETVSVLGSSGGVIQEASKFRISDTPLTPEQQLGRKLFYSADDSRMTNSQAGGIACASCHPNGRDDGRTWKFTEGNRNTPTLAGRDLAATAPYHWDGTLATFNDFDRIVHDRMGGSGEDSSAGVMPLSQDDFNAIFAYLQSLPRPDNPSLNKDGTPVNADAVARGKVVFEGKAQCVSCHSGADHTDNGFHDVGTEGHLTADGVPESFPNHVNTPPLHGLFFSAPYLHDGSIATLQDRLNNNPNDLHGITSTLTDQEKSDLVAYLQTL